MKMSLCCFCILSTSFLYGLHESTLTEVEKEVEKEKLTIFLFAQKAEYRNDFKEELRQNLRKHPHIINAYLNKTTPYFMDIAYRGWWNVFELLLEEQENIESPCEIDIKKEDNNLNNLIHVLTQTKTPPRILERACKLFPYLLRKYNAEERQRLAPLNPENNEEGHHIISEYVTLTPLELLLITKKDPWIEARILLKYGAEITDIARFALCNDKDKHPITTKLFEKHTEQLHEIESLALPSLRSQRNHARRNHAIFKTTHF